MVIIRLAKISMIAALATYALIVSYDNVVDYDSNYQFVSHVMSMDTVSSHALMNRAITDKSAWSVAYAVIIAIEGLTGALLALGALVLLVRIAAPAEVFNRAKVWAVVGMTLGYGLWFFVFLVVAGEYFEMWQSTPWNGQQAAFRIATEFLGVLIFVSLPDGELK